MSARKPVLLTWQDPTAPRLESVRLRTGENGLRASGRLVAGTVTEPETKRTEAHSASYELVAGGQGVLTRLLLRTTTADEERQVSVSRTEEGIWLIDHGQGVKRSAFSGALDVDVRSCVLFNALPIRRLRLHREAGTHELPVVYIDLPTLQVTEVVQEYSTVEIREDGATIRYTSGEFSADLEVDSEGLLLTYPGWAQRI
ncbi:hypothetical protein D5S17_21210 [Pseudonocardiaceae bacterium YIM PH 21723]|nr:hypothetical protein D5S17_21210 [Pseudonocardiaceae bacterium YIM PH 21723]